MSSLARVKDLSAASRSLLEFVASTRKVELDDSFLAPDEEAIWRCLAKVAERAPSLYSGRGSLNDRSVSRLKRTLAPERNQAIARLDRVLMPVPMRELDRLLPGAFMFGRHDEVVRRRLIQSLTLTNDELATLMRVSVDESLIDSARKSVAEIDLPAHERVGFFIGSTISRWAPQTIVDAVWLAAVEPIAREAVSGLHATVREYWTDRTPSPDPPWEPSDQTRRWSPVTHWRTSVGHPVAFRDDLDYGPNRDAAEEFYGASKVLPRDQADFIVNSGMPASWGGASGSLDFPSSTDSAYERVAAIGRAMRPDAYGWARSLGNMRFPQLARLAIKDAAAGIVCRDLISSDDFELITQVWYTGLERGRTMTALRAQQDPLAAWQRFEVLRMSQDPVSPSELDSIQMVTSAVMALQCAVVEDDHPLGEVRVHLVSGSGRLYEFALLPSNFIRVAVGYWWQRDTATAAAFTGWTVDPRLLAAEHRREWMHDGTSVHDAACWREWPTFASATHIAEATLELAVLVDGVHGAGSMGAAEEEELPPDGTLKRNEDAVLPVDGHASVVELGVALEEDRAPEPRR